MCFAIVKKHIDALDRLGLLASGAPSDEYDIESRMIAQRITTASTADDIAIVIGDVFSQMFKSEKSDPTFVRCAECIYRDLQDKTH